MYFYLFLQVERQFHDALLFGAGEVLDDHALVVMLKPNAAELLLEFAVLELGLLSFSFLFLEVLTWRLGL